MTFIPMPGIQRLFLWTLFFLATGVAYSEAKASEMKLEAVLIWGTNEDKEKYPNYKEADATIRNKLMKIFMWRNYLEINRKSVSVPEKQTRKVKMSDECEIEIKNHGDSKVEVKLIGKGQLVLGRTQPIAEKERIVLGGDDKNQTAWFLVLTRVPAK